MKVKSIPVCVRIPEPIYKKLEESVKNGSALSIPEKIRRILDDYFNDSRSSRHSSGREVREEEEVGGETLE